MNSTKREQTQECEDPKRPGHLRVLGAGPRNDRKSKGKQARSGGVLLEVQFYSVISGNVVEGF